jgi:hypothetical protein
MDDFLESRAWLELRYRVLKKGKGCCQLCGTRGSESNPLQVDHIKPRSKHPELALAESNLQILCRRCNVGKSNKDKTDWRVAASVELAENIAVRTAILESANPEQKAKLEQLGWLRRNDVDAHIRKEAEKQYKAIWKKLEDELKARDT